MHSITKQAIKKAKGLILNQVRYVHPTTISGFKYDSESMEEGAEAITDDAVLSMLKGKDIISNHNIAKMVSSMGLEALYDEDAWVDPVADYIIEHRDSCRDLWKHIESLGRSC